jgi:hypothetical protein
LSTNDRIIKLWNIDYKVKKQPVTNCEIVEDEEEEEEPMLMLPETEIVSEGFEGVMRREYKNCH